MATFEDFTMAFQFHTVMENIRKSILINAQWYIDVRAAGAPVADIVAVAQQNTNQYDAFLIAINAAWSDPVIQPKIESGLLGLGIPYMEYTAAYTEMRTVVNDEMLALSLGITIEADLLSFANATLTNLQSHHIWP